MHLAANGFKNFFPTIVETLGFGTTITLVLTCPPYLIAGIISIYWSWQSGKTNERTWHITSAKTVAVIGFVLACATLNTGARYFAMCVFAIGTCKSFCCFLPSSCADHTVVDAVNSIVLGWVSATCGQTKEKKASSLAIVNTIANVSFIWTPVSVPLKMESSNKSDHVYSTYGPTHLRLATFCQWQQVVSHASACR